jgi:hypothetical protein
MIIATRKEARDADHRTIATSNARSTPVTIHICTAYEKKTYNRGDFRALIISTFGNYH